jgi:hypothetical protein
VIDAVTWRPRRTRLKNIQKQERPLKLAQMRNNLAMERGTGPLGIDHNHRFSFAIDPDSWYPVCPRRPAQDDGVAIRFSDHACGIFNSESLP